MSFLDFSAVGTQFSNKSLKLKEKYGKSKVKQKTNTAWSYLNLTNNFDKVDWHKRCLKTSNLLTNCKVTNINNFPSFFEHR